MPGYFTVRNGIHRNFNAGSSNARALIIVRCMPRPSSPHHQGETAGRLPRIYHLRFMVLYECVWLFIDVLDGWLGMALLRTGRLARTYANVTDYGLWIINYYG